jgi:hypothetical protein
MEEINVDKVQLNKTNNNLQKHSISVNYEEKAFRL